MKTTIFIGLTLLFIGITSSAFAQVSNDPQLPKNISDYQTDKPVVVETYQQPYIIKSKKLITFFKDGSIPYDFPRYDYSLTKKENKALIKEWYYTGDNKELLSPEGRAKVAELQDKANQ